jgi:cell division protein FtsL
MIANPSQRYGRKQAQRLPDHVYKERRFLLILMATSFLGTLTLLYITAHASATGEGYQRSQLRDAISREEKHRLYLQTELNRRSSGAAIDQAAEKNGLIRNTNDIRFLKLDPQGH